MRTFVLRRPAKCDFVDWNAMHRKNRESKEVEPPREEAAKAPDVGSSGKSRLYDRAIAWAAGFKPLLEVLALILGAGWFLSQCAIGDFTPAAEFSLDVSSRVHDPVNPKNDRVAIKATFKGARGLVELKHTKMTISGANLACPDLETTIDASSPTLTVPAGDALTFACVADIPIKECGTIAARITGKRAFAFIRTWRLPDWLPWTLSSWRAAVPSCPVAENK
jgi:hypothetical protein